MRNGTDNDAARLYCRFKELQFDVTLFTDLKVKEVERELKKGIIIEDIFETFTYFKLYVNIKIYNYYL